jgi:hypothetical protein
MYDPTGYQEPAVFWLVGAINYYRAAFPGEVQATVKIISVYYHKFLSVAMPCPEPSIAI